MSGTKRAFTPLQRLLHWLMAICLLTMLFVGVGMVATVSPAYVSLVSFHKTLGIVILLLVVIRLIVRLVYGAPALPADMPPLMKLAAHLSHLGFYVLMFAMPLIGWAMLSAAGYPIVLLGGVTLPPILSPDRATHAVLWTAHQYLAYAFFALILAHAAAALYHAFFRRDGVFEQMTTGASDRVSR
ncbi:cytochrome b [Oryzifoliimicrobium ureilyticus]|uniref:cytochrome b n=1 Tax=Oryzifoliimicrobium ureilyticus TaxID=3113724 RepID=UPI00307637D8